MSSKRQSAPQSFVEAKSCTRKRWTDEERKSLWDQRLLYSDLTWPEFYKLGLFPDRTEKALRLEFAENQEKKKLVSSQPTNNIPVSSTSAKPRSSPASKVTASMTTTSSPKPIAFCGCKRHRAEGDDGKDSNRRHEKVQRTEQPGATTRNQPGSERPPETVQNAAPLTPTPANAIGQRQALTRVSQAQIINLDEVASPADKVSTMAGPATVTSTPSRNAIVSESSISEVKAEPVPHEDQRTGTSTPMAPNSTRAHLVRTPASADKPQGTAPAKARLVSQLHASKPPAAERVVATPVNDKGPATPLSNGPNLARQAQPSQTTTSTSQAQRPPMAALAICKSNDQPQANQGLTQNRPGSPPDRMQSTSTSTPANTNPIGPWQPSQRASLDKPAVVPSAAQKASISTPIKPSRATQPPVSNNISQNEDAVARPEQLSKQSTSGGATGQTQSTISAAPERPSPATNSHRNIGHSITPRAQTPVTHSQPTMDTQPLSQLAGAVPREQSSARPPVLSQPNQSPKAPLTNNSSSSSTHPNSNLNPAVPETISAGQSHNALPASTVPGYKTNFISTEGMTRDEKVAKVHQCVAATSQWLALVSTHDDVAHAERDHTAALNQMRSDEQIKALGTLVGVLKQTVAEQSEQLASQGKMLSALEASGVVMVQGLERRVNAVEGLTHDAVGAVKQNVGRIDGLEKQVGKIMGVFSGLSN